MKLTLREAAEAMGVTSETSGTAVSGWSVDTRTLAPGDLYFALRGPNHDGHKFAAQAMSQGAAGVVTERPMDGALVVSDTLRALQRLAGKARTHWGGTVVGVTGSAGKTSTKDAIAHLLGTIFPTGKTVGNFNNHIGVPLSILRLPDEAQVAVLEMGMNHSGEIRELCAIAKPDVGVVTNVGWAHAENFTSIEDVALAKRELIESLPSGGTAILNADDERVARFAEVHAGPKVTFGIASPAEVRGEEIELIASGTKFKACGTEFESQLAGRHGVMNILAGIAAARVFGVPASRLVDAVRTFTPGKMRGEQFVRAGVRILNDCYNSNPEAARAMVDVLKATPARRRIAVLGEMLELGRLAEPLHREVGNYVAGRGIDVLIGIRGAARHMVDEAMLAGLPGGAAYFFDDPAEAGNFVSELAEPGDAVLFKGSRGVQVEKAMERLLERTPPAPGKF
ncbi:MAG: UDP-N-acetylmuramoyl-tripeptide--D-alanyl-D-alanine ligase [Bryobacterales bacterium]|nr:UDP-N-acetylmuramoyl-tripeptide--D-alanyl-D-alanine ligase [Bryobacterales bacterium]